MSVEMATSLRGALEIETDSKEASPDSEVEEVPISSIRIGERARQDMGDLRRLADSIETWGT